MIVVRRRGAARALLGALALPLLLGLATGCSTAPDRSGAAAAITDRLRALPGTLAVDGRYANGRVEGVSFNVDVRMDANADLDQVLATVDAYYDGLVDGDFAGHTSRYQVRLADDLIQVFGTEQHRDRPTDEVRRWFALVAQVPGAVHWAVGPDPATDIRSISVEIPDTTPLAVAVAEISTDAPDLADRRWIVRWRHLRLDLMGAPYPPDDIASTLERLATEGDWSVVYDPASNPTLTMAVWATSPNAMESTARQHLPIVSELGLPVRYTVRGNGVEPAEVLVGGCLRGGSALQQQLNDEFGTC